MSRSFYGGVPGGRRELLPGAAPERRYPSREKNRKTAAFGLLAAFVTGLSLVLYPSLSNYINVLHQTREIAAYAQEVEGLDAAVCGELRQKAEIYNASLSSRDNPYQLTEEQEVAYPGLLDISRSGAMGYIEIPSLEVMLPIYHGTSDAVLQRAVGHLAWTSLPVGGESTHSVLSGHRGLPSSRLFTDLDKLSAGDIFLLRVLDETLTYEVDQILIVEPQDVSALQIAEGKDYCTLITCTPYGINTHRLLIRGHRIENRTEAGNIRLIAEAVQIEPLVIAPLLSIPLLLLLVLLTLF
ncbi:class C sortase [Lachnoclostridium sp. Marseille-P6806]|uniref:class C sortase n=1 Tax=Lachnoclostridium sp. Marseille-P6806 TaxID=2364793 RepID=UPI001F5F2A9B|nr:class C sortase [Lachnoclostridium sp. Marseille-P6806]